MNPAHDQTQPLEAEAYTEAIARIIQVSRHEVREILDQAGGRKALKFMDGALEIQALLPGDLRAELLKHVDALKGAIAHTCPAERLVIASPNKRSMTLTVQPADSSLIDSARTLEQRQEFKRVLRLEARCRVAMEQAKDLIVITDRRGWYLDCNFTKPRFGVDRMDAIGEMVDDLFPHLADLAHEQLAEAFKFPEIGIYRDFVHEPIAGIPQHFRARTVAYGEEALTQVTLLNTYPWLS